MKRLLAGVLLLLGATTSPAYAEQIYVTGYSSSGVMANGQWTHPGAAACPRWLPLGSAVHVQGIGDLECSDRYAECLEWLPRIDVYVSTVSQAFALTGNYAWWRL